jgi:hypothetical protein
MKISQGKFLGVFFFPSRPSRQKYLGGQGRARAAKKQKWIG